jgi:sodium transport system permease protein
MRLANIAAIVRKEGLDLVRDRRSVISMLVVPLVVFPLIFSGMTRLMPKLEQRAEEDLQKMGIAARVSNPAVRETLNGMGLKISEPEDLKAAVQKKTVAAAVEEVAGSPPEFRVYIDASEPVSTAGGDRIREALTALREQKIRDGLHQFGIDLSVLASFTVKQTNIAGERKMAGALWGSMLGYLLLLLMFTGGMYPIMDMTAGEKERKTMEALLVAPVERREIVLGKTLTAIFSILVTAGLMLTSMVVSFKNAGTGSRSVEGRRFEAMLGTIPLDGTVVTLLALTLLPLAVFAASAMFAIALKARSFKEAQTYLTPLMLLVIFPALLGGIPGLKITPALCLVPIFNASQVIRGILLGDVAMLNFGLTLAANLIYAGVALFLATRMYEDENVLFRS